MFAKHFLERTNGCTSGMKQSESETSGPECEGKASEGGSATVTEFSGEASRLFAGLRRLKDVRELESRGNDAVPLPLVSKLLEAGGAAIFKALRASEHCGCLLQSRVRWNLEF